MSRGKNKPRKSSGRTFLLLLGEVVGDPHNFEVSHFYSPAVCRFTGKTCARARSPLHRHTVPKPDPSAEPNRPAFWTPSPRVRRERGLHGRRPENSFPARSSYHGRRSKAEQGVPVPETGKLNRKLRSQLRFRPPPLGQERARPGWKVQPKECTVTWLGMESKWSQK